MFEQHLVGYKLKLRTSGLLWFIPSHYLGVLDNYNKEKSFFRTFLFLMILFIKRNWAQKIK